MRKSNKQIIYEACELIESYKEDFSCLAIECSKLVKRYENFYDKDQNVAWGFSLCGSKHGKQERILALLLFAEVCL